MATDLTALETYLFDLNEGQIKTTLLIEKMSNIVDDGFGSLISYWADSDVPTITALNGIRTEILKQNKNSFEQERKDEVAALEQQTQSDLLRKQNSLLEEQLKLNSTDEKKGISKLLSGGLGGLLGGLMTGGLKNAKNLLGIAFSPIAKMLSVIGIRTGGLKGKGILGGLKGKGILGGLKGKGILGGLKGKGILKNAKNLLGIAFSPIAKMLSVIGIRTGGLKGLGFLGSLKVIGKGILKKVLFPLQAILSIFDFVDGFKNAKEITGEDGVLKKIQAGVSSVLSGLSFGIFDAKTVYKGIEYITDEVVKIFNDSSEYVKSLISEYKIAEKINSRVDEIKERFGSFTKMVNDEFSSGIASIKEKIFSFTSEMFDFTELKEMYESIKEKVFSFFNKPIDYLKGLVTSKIDNVSDVEFKQPENKNTKVNDAFKQPERQVVPLTSVARKNEQFPEIKKEVFAKNKKQEVKVKPEPKGNTNLVNNTTNNITNDYDLSTDLPIYRNQFAY